MRARLTLGGVSDRQVPRGRGIPSAGGARSEARAEASRGERLAGRCERRLRNGVVAPGGVEYEGDHGALRRGYGIGGVPECLVSVAVSTNVNLIKKCKCMVGASLHCAHSRILSERCTDKCQSRDRSRVAHRDRRCQSEVE